MSTAAAPETHKIETATEAVKGPQVAVMFRLPRPIAFSSPMELIVTRNPFVQHQCTPLVRGCELPSLKCPITAVSDRCPNSIVMF